MTTVITKRLGYLAAAERLLRALGPVEYCPDQRPETVRRHLAGARIVLATKGVTIDGDALDAAPGLRVVAAPTAGFDWIDITAATARGIPVIANTGAAADAVAEFTLGTVLALTRRIVAADRELRGGADWAAVRDRYSRADLRIGGDLTTSTVAIVGLGHIGRKVAQKLAVLRPATLIGYDPFLPAAHAAELGVELCADLLDCVRRADVLLLHVPLTARTAGLVGAEVLAALPPRALLVNCSRGEVVDEPALVEALESGRIAGAALDVFAEEPLPVDSPLRRLDNVILTPHIAGVTAQSDETRAREIGERVLAAAAGTRPVGLVNPEVWDNRRPFDGPLEPK
ncbi:NAD(P)-dependent oxidoreductase [Phytohabitans sp. ZYX-F-186]|uniref:NAD(P)-dependent oxidoreductase n=1 Tax=Phytohabitans maris TaxID=3071409 RepID=A0ABU0ZC33_9ACTN|nr:NAD(P)-dependent oxidoreductase [Phytohabitans sp. ZYX-F-186]MDQ7904623.1 NAD(P)-dependent oxidoreductase [Phytohabitans sp. ZYX-F-186]